MNEKYKTFEELKDLIRGKINDKNELNEIFNKILEIAQDYELLTREKIKKENENNRQVLVIKELEAKNILLKRMILGVVEERGDYYE